MSRCGHSNPTFAALDCNRTARANPGRASGTPSSADSRRFSCCFTCSQLRSTSSAVCAWPSPNTWGCRRISFSVMPFTTGIKSNRPSSAAIWAYSTTCNNRSPSSSAIPILSSASIASKTSNVSSSVKGSMVFKVCSRSQGHPSGARNRATTATKFQKASLTS